MLDLVHVRSGQSSADAIAATRSLARLADRLGYTRYWIAEHHNMPASAATSPPVLIGMLAAITERIRLGSGGVLLPNHASLVLAEQFALLEAAFPGRIDLGVGRASGTDPLTSRALGDVGGTLDDLLTLLSAGGAQVPDTGRRQLPRATPAAASTPSAWLLGASTGSARTAAEHGMPYVFGHHLGVPGAGSALREYRSAFRPSPGRPEPRTLLPVRAAVAETSDEAYRAALPWLVVMLGLSTGQPQRPVPTIEEAAKIRLSRVQRETVDRMAAQYVIGDPDQARGRITELASEYEVDEVMIHPIASAPDGADPGRAPGHEQTLRLLAETGMSPVRFRETAPTPEIAS